MTTARIIIVGHGKMAAELEATTQELGREVIRFDALDRKNWHELIEVGLVPGRRHGWVIVHFGSGRQLSEAIKACKKLTCPLIQGSTGIDLQCYELPLTVPTVDAPNLCLQIVGLLRVFPQLAAAIPETDRRLVETHQVGKTSVPGTARLMAQSMGMPEDAIVSVRDLNTQRLLGVPAEFLGGHGWHFATFAAPGVTILVQTAVNGRRPYALGAITIADTLIQHAETLAPRVYDVTELLDLIQQS